MVRGVRWLVVVLLALASGGCAILGGPPPARHRVETGTASFYGARFDGRVTASGVRYDSSKMLAAHRSLPFGTKVRVTHLGNRRSVVVTVVDRGPYRRGRVIDLSRRAAGELGFLRQGLASVQIEVVED